MPQLDISCWCKLSWWICFTQTKIVKLCRKPWRFRWGLVTNLLTGTWIRCSEWPNPSQWPSSPWWHQIPQHLRRWHPASFVVATKSSPPTKQPSSYPAKIPEARAQTEPNRKREPGDDQQDGEFAEVRISWMPEKNWIRWKLPQLFSELHRGISLKSFENCKYFCDAYGYIMLYPIRPQPWKIVSSFSEFSLICNLVAQEP